ncbi:peptide MFS transporter [Flammeovirgaceae bacterium SG7u.111]|nr:peptide MFS transporter [Flammeovirgaceae bacterium SG7u.132]WPO34100.1 peptide MFS transporter [Flammeovirgaceae bacterium SG7u.111]
MSSSEKGNALAVDHGEWLGHPKGLFILFFTEMWERFSYYGMRAILVLFIVSSVAEGGLGWTTAEALSLYGFYTMFVYLMSIPGGWLADNFLGQKKSVMLGGALLVVGHGVMAIPGMLAFYSALVLIVLGVGCLKPNISTMVGGLYKQGDPRRDQGFTIFYIGINVGAFLSGILVAVVADAYGWHAGFGLAGIGMLLGQLLFIYGQKYLVGVGDFVPAEKVKDKSGVHDKPLTKIEKDRIVVLLISFLIVVVFWGAFEQAGGLMNIYAQYKTDRFIGLFNYTIPAGVFQSVNSFYIMVFGMVVAGFWANRALKGKETSTLLKMGIGTIIMGIGFLFMSAATLETEASGDYKSGMYWLLLAYLFHTIGELCVSPTALSFITKLAPVKYASLMMGIYFAATGVGNKLAASLGEAAQSEPTKVEISYSELMEIAPNFQDEDIDLGYLTVEAVVQKQGDELIATGSGTAIKPLLTFVEGDSKHLKSEVMSVAEDFNNEIGLIFSLNPITEEEGVAEEITENTNFEGTLLVREVQNNNELRIFTIIAGFSIAFGLLLLVFFKKLKALTHNAEDVVVE